MGQHAKVLPCSNKLIKKKFWLFFSLRASMMTLVSRRNIAISASRHFAKAGLGFLAQFPNPLGRTLLELRMVLVFPSAGRIFESRDLPAAHQLFLSGFANETAALTRANQTVDFLHQLIGEHHMCTFGLHALVPLLC